VSPGLPDPRDPRRNLPVQCLRRVVGEPRALPQLQRDGPSAVSP